MERHHSAGASVAFKSGGQVVIQEVMWSGTTAGGAFYSAKKWGGNCPPAPPSLTPLIVLQLHFPAWLRFL